MAADSMATGPRREALGVFRWVGYLLVADALLTAFRAVDFARFVFCEDCYSVFGSLGVALYAALSLVSWRLWAVWQHLRAGERSSKWKGMLIAVYACLLFPVIFMFSVGSVADIAGVELPPDAFNIVGVGVSLGSFVLFAMTVVSLARGK